MNFAENQWVACPICYQRLTFRQARCHSALADEHRSTASPPAGTAHRAGPDLREARRSAGGRPAAAPSAWGRRLGAAAEADQIRARAESDAAGMLRKAEAAAEHAARARSAAEAEIQAVKNEVAALRTDLERREARLAEREQRLDDEIRRLEERSAALDELRGDLEGERADLDRLGGERRQVLEQAAGPTTAHAKAELLARV